MPNMQLEHVYYWLSMHVRISGATQVLVLKKNQLINTLLFYNAHFVAMGAHSQNYLVLKNKTNKTIRQILS